MTVLAVLVFAAVLVAAFWPRPVLVDMGPVRRGAMAVTIDEEGRTRVKDPYVVSSPVAGDLQRVSVLPGEVVIGGVTVVAWMQPANPSALDVRTREQVRAAVNAAASELCDAGAKLLFVACSEFSLIADDVKAPVPVVDTVDLLCAAIVHFSQSAEAMP